MEEQQQENSSNRSNSQSVKQTQPQEFSEQVVPHLPSDKRPIPPVLITVIATMAAAFVGIGVWLWLASVSKTPTSSVPEKESLKPAVLSEKQVQQEFVFKVALPQDASLEISKLKASHLGNSTAIDATGGFNLNNLEILNEIPRTNVFIETEQDQQILASALFSRPFAEDVLEPEALEKMEPWLWPNEEAVVIDARSTAIFLMTTALRTLLLGAEDGETALVKWLPIALDNPRLPELENQTAFLIKQGKSYLDDETVFKLAEEIAREAAYDQTEARATAEEDLFDCGTDESCFYSRLEKCLPTASAHVPEGMSGQIFEFRTFGYEGDDCIVESKNLTLKAAISCDLPRALFPISKEVLESEEILSKYCRPFFLR